MNRISLKAYDVVIDSVKSSLSSFLADADYGKVFVLLDENTRKNCWPIIKGNCEEAILIEVQSGEEFKSLRSCEYIWRELAKHGGDRNDLLINLGGGVIGDMGGFSASCYMRGIDFIQIPTTLLSQVDASVGGKLGVDLDGLKNFVGVFNNPQLVCVDPEFLSTLPIRQLRSGYAEVIKHSLICNEDIWKRLRSTEEWPNLDWGQEIYESIKIKSDVVLKDPYESGLRKILNFGHTMGHAFETISLHSEFPMLHGEAIALGMICEAWLSLHLSTLTSEEFDDIRKYIMQVFDDLDWGVLKEKEATLRYMKSDKKNKAGEIRMSLLKQIGECDYNITVMDEMILNCLQNCS